MTISKPVDDPVGCDIPPSPDLSQVLDALRARARAALARAGHGAKRFGSLSWMHAWALGVVLLATVGAGLAGTHAVLNAMGRWCLSFGWIAVAGVEAPAVMPGVPFGSALLGDLAGLGALAAALFLARGALWIAVEGPVRLWSAFSNWTLGNKGSPPSRHCFAPWTLASVVAFVIAVFAAAIVSLSIEISANASKLIQAEREAIAAVKRSAAAAPPAVAAYARGQVEALADGKIERLDDTAMPVGSRQAFWNAAVAGWDESVVALVNKDARLTSTDRVLGRSSEDAKRDQAELADARSRRERLINGYWATLGVDKGAARVAHLRAVGDARSPWRTGTVSRGPLAICLAVPARAHNFWMDKRGAFSAQARAAMGTYFTRGDFDPPKDLCWYDGGASVAVTTLGNYFEWGSKRVQNPEGRWEKADIVSFPSEAIGWSRSAAKGRVAKSDNGAKVEE